MRERATFVCNYLLDWCNDGKFDADPKIVDD